MNKFYPQNRFENIVNFIKTSVKGSAVVALMMIFLPTFSNAQQVYTILQGEFLSSTQGVTPFATVVKNQRSQYMYSSTLLQDLNIPNGYVTSVAVKITQLASPSTLKPENLQIKMGQTTMPSLPATLIPDLAVHYSTPVENIDALGWHTFVLDTPFAWDGFSNIVMEFCRTNTMSSNSFEVEVHLGLIDQYRTSALMNNTPTSNGCTLTGETIMTLPNRRLLPSMQLTMSNPCETNPIAGVMVVSESANYCGDSFTLSATGDSIESGLAFQWQSSFDGIEFTDIMDAVSSTLTTTQEFATYYRRGIMCMELGVMIYPPAILVSSPDCFCHPTVTTQDAAGITNVFFSGINSTSESTSTYTNYSNLPAAAVDRTGSYDLSARVTATTDAMTTKAWIDWNQDGTFSTSEAYNLGVISTGVDVASGMIANVVVPADAVMGETVMRVRTATVASNGTLEPCGNTINGETEDYKINVGDGLGIPNAEILNSSIVVYGNDKSVNVRSTIEGITNIKIYDISGRILYNANDINSNETAILLSGVSSQILIVEVKTVSGFILNKKVSLK